VAIYDEVLAVIFYTENWAYFVRLSQIARDIVGYTSFLFVAFDLVIRQHF